MKTVFVFSTPAHLRVVCRNAAFAWALLLLAGTQAQAQATTVKSSIFGGYVVAGYVDDGGFTNFTGPNITLTRGNSVFMLSALPSLRYKVDRSEPHSNAFVTPALGAGFTYAYKKVAFQLASYYNSRTATADGQWHLGFGLGLRMSEFNKKK